MNEVFTDVYAGVRRGRVNTAKIKQIMDSQTTEIQRAAQNRKAMQNKNAPPEQRFSFVEQKIPTYEELIAKPDIDIVDITDDGVGTAKELRDRIDDKEKERICSTPVINKDTGEKVFIVPRTFTHMFSNQGIEQVKAARKIREIVENAVLTHAEPSRNDGQDHTTGVYTLFAAAKDGERVYPVKIKLKEYRMEGQSVPKEVRKYISENGLHSNAYSKTYDGRVLVTDEIKSEETSSSATTITPENTGIVSHPSASSAISVANLINLVKGDAAKYLPKPMRKYKKVDVSATLNGASAKSGQDTGTSDSMITENDRTVKQEFSIDEDAEKLDREYLSAVEDGDMETAQKMVEEAAKKAGYTNSENWRIPT